MSRIEELIEVLSSSDAFAGNPNAKARHACKICNQPAKHFRNAKAELEYHISAICQDCQDYYFPVEH